MTDTAKRESFPLVTRHALQTRRGLIVGLAAVLAAPAIVRASSLMPIRGDVYRFWEWSCPMLPDPSAFSQPDYREKLRGLYFGPNGRLYKGTWTFFGKDHNIYSDEQVGFFKEEYPS